MIKNIDKKLITLDGIVIVNDGKEVSMRNIIIDALLEGSLENITAEEKVQRYHVALKCKNGGEVDFKPEEIVTIKNLSGKRHTPLVIGQLFEFLDE